MARVPREAYEDNMAEVHGSVLKKRQGQGHSQKLISGAWFGFRGSSIDFYALLAVITRTSFRKRV